jgi:hypothetical protein
MCLSPDRVKPKTIKFVCVASGWLRIICPSGATCLSADCGFSELALLKSKHVGLVHSIPHHHLNENRGNAKRGVSPHLNI